MADIQPLTSKKADRAPSPAKTEGEDVANLSPQELEAKKAADAGRKEEERQTKIDELIKSRKYFLPIKR